MSSGQKSWTQINSSMSDKSARDEFGLTQEDIIQGIREGKLQYRENSIHGNPYLRLLRSEIEDFVKNKYGEDYIKKKINEKELRDLNKEINSLKRKISTLEKKKIELWDIQKCIGGNQN